MRCLSSACSFINTYHHPRSTFHVPRPILASSYHTKCVHVQYYLILQGNNKAQFIKSLLIQIDLLPERQTLYQGRLSGVAQNREVAVLSCKSLISSTMVGQLQ